MQTTDGQVVIISMPTTLLQASARPDGNTFQVATRLARELNAVHLDLLNYRVYPFRYDQCYPSDDGFLHLVRHALLPYDRIVFATPVYWYTMSGGMKTFFDRLSDLLVSEKEVGRQLRGKTMSVLSVSNGDDLPEHFTEPFRLTAAYLGMTFGESWHGWVDSGQPRLVQWDA